MIDNLLHYGGAPTNSKQQAQPPLPSCPPLSHPPSAIDQEQRARANQPIAAPESSHPLVVPKAYGGLRRKTQDIESGIAPHRAHIGGGGIADTDTASQTKNMPPHQQQCSRCRAARPVLRRPRTGARLCRACFLRAFEDEVHETIVAHGLFRPGERVAVGASGGKDSTVLASVLATLNRRHGYGLDLFLLSVDEGIAGYRDDSLDAVRQHAETFNMPLVVVSYKQLYGWSMDEVVRSVGTRGNCTYCGVLRRQALDRGAAASKADKVATGHNADDAAETVLLNLLRGDVARLGRTASAETGAGGPLPRVKPLRCAYEKEVVAYAYFAGLKYFSTECAYAPFAARGLARDFVKDLEAARPSAIADLLHSAETLRVAVAAVAVSAGAGASCSAAAAAAAPGSSCSAGGASCGGGGGKGPAAASCNQEGCAGKEAATARIGRGGAAAAVAAPAAALPAAAPGPKTCVRCGYMTSQEVCKACTLLEGLNKGRARVELLQS